MKLNFSTVKTIAKSSIPFVLGLLIGAGWSKNKYFLHILITYFIVMFIYRLISNKIMSIKKASDKKMAMVEEGNRLIDYLTPIFEWTYKQFDTFFPFYTFMVSLGMLSLSIILFFYGYKVYSLILFIAVNVQIIQNNIWRQVK